MGVGAQRFCGLRFGFRVGDETIGHESCSLLPRTVRQVKGLGCRGSRASCYMEVMFKNSPTHIARTALYNSQQGPQQLTHDPHMVVSPKIGGLGFRVPNIDPPTYSSPYRDPSNGTANSGKPFNPKPDISLYHPLQKFPLIVPHRTPHIIPKHIHKKGPAHL